MKRQSRHKRAYHTPTIIHHGVCQHQVEIEVWPSEAEVYFQDERDVDPVNTQVRFDTVVYNAPSGNVLWEVKDISGEPGVGSIDPTGLYTAPPKGEGVSSLPHGMTDIIIATAVDDPLRKAFARITLVGFGPAPVPKAKLEIFPKQVYLYYPSGHHNAYIDESNKMQIFRAIIRNSDSTTVAWEVNGNPAPGASQEPWYLYKTSYANTEKVTVKVSLVGDLNIQDEANVIQINYIWPGFV